MTFGGSVESGAHIWKAGCQVSCQSKCISGGKKNTPCVMELIGGARTWGNVGIVANTCLPFGMICISCHKKSISCHQKCLSCHKKLGETLPATRHALVVQGSKNLARRNAFLVARNFRLGLGCLLGKR